MEQQETTPNINMAAVGLEAAAQAQGQAPDHSLLEDAIAQVQGGLDAKVQEIRDDRRLTRDEQRAKITDLWNRASAAYPQILKNYERVLAEDVDKAEHRLFYVATDRDSVRSAYNDLYDRVKPLRQAGQFEESREELERFAVRARRTGDRALKTAVGHLATELGEGGLRDAWIAASEEKTKAWNDLNEAQTKLEHFKDPHERMWMRMTRPSTLRKPEEA